MKQAPLSELCHAALLSQIPALLSQIPALLTHIPALLSQVPALLSQIPAGWLDKLAGMQMVTDEMWAGRSDRFPEETPSTKEYYLLRSIFEEHFPSQSALDTVPKV